MSSRYIAVRELTDSVFLGITHINKEKSEVELEYCSKGENGAYNQITLPSTARLRRTVNTREIVFQFVGELYRIKEFRKVGESA